MASLPGDTQSTVVRTGKELSRATTMDLTDSEVSVAVREIVQIQNRYASRQATEANLQALKDEVIHRMYAIGILATFDPTPLLNGEPPAIEILGKVEDGEQTFDHEKEGWEVNRANLRGEDFYGQKEKPR